MNKKAEVATITIILWIAGIVIALFVAKEVGLFEVFIPNVGQPSGTNSLINQVYYGGVTELTNWVCSQSENVYFRTTDLTYTDTSGGVAYSSIPGSPLIRYGISTGACTNHYCDSIPPINVPGGAKMWVDSDSLLCICSSSKLGTHTYAKALKTAISTTVSTSLSVIDSTKELYINSPIKDLGNLTCENGDIVTKYCGSFGSVINVTCPSNQPCSYLPNYNTPNGYQLALKCGDNTQFYKPNQKLCVGNSLFNTSLDGRNIFETICGYACSNNQCIECGPNGIKRCSSTPTSSSDIDICSAGFWIPSNIKCQGIEQCSQGACTSDFNIGDKKCNGTQPKILNSQKIWINDGEACDLACNEISTTETTCTQECQLGYSCAGGVLFQCLADDRDNENYNRGVCDSGTCIADNSRCSSRYNIRDKYCSDGDVYIGINSGNDYDVFGGVIGQFSKNCLNGCLNGECLLIGGCSGNAGQSICADSVTRKTCSNDSQSYTSTENCQDLGTRGFCNQTTKQCQLPSAVCSGNRTCANGINIKECNSGEIGNILYSCNGFGCENDQYGFPICINECTIEDSYTCKSGSSYICKEATDGSNQLLLNLSRSCGSIGCNSETGRCNTECTANLNKCATDEYIHSCNSNSTLGPIIDECNQKGCSTNTEACNNDCPLFNPVGIGFKCSGTNSYECYTNSTQLLQRSTTCSELGCKESTGKCKSCSNINYIIGEIQKSYIETNAKVTGIIQESNDGIILTNIQGTLNGGGYNLQSTGASDSGGNFDLSFGTNLPLGIYNVSINIPSCNRSFIVTLKISNDYSIKLSDVVALLKYPEIKPSVALTVIGNGTPDDIIIIGDYNGITYKDISFSDVTGKWILTIDGDPGFYKIQVSAVSLGITQDPQTIPIEIRNPTLTISSNLPASSKPGKQTIQVSTVGPTSKNQLSANIEPDTISTKIDDQDIECKKQGAGKCIIDYTFDLGTHTLFVDAQKAGYDSLTAGYSKTIVVSSGGGGGGTSNQTCTLNSDCNGGVCTNGKCVGGGFDLDTKTLLILGGIGVVAYFLLRKRRR